MPYGPRTTSRRLPQMLLDLLDEVLCGNYPHHGIDMLAVLEEENARYRAHAEARCGVLIRVDIELRDLDSSLILPWRSPRRSVR